MTHPNDHTDNHTNTLTPPRRPTRPVNLCLRGIFLSLSSGNNPPTSNAPQTYDNTKWPKRRPRQPTTTPLPTSPMWKRLKTASMSRQRRRMALSASNDVARTRKCFFAAFSSATYSSITPIRRHDTPFTPDGHQDPKHAGGHKPPAIICFFKAPIHITTHGTNKYDPQGPHTIKIRL